MLVTRQGHLPMVIQLLRHGADPSIADGEGYRSLHLSILYQHLAIAAYLMAKGQVCPSHPSVRLFSLSLTFSFSWSLSLSL